MFVVLGSDEERVRFAVAQTRIDFPTSEGSFSGNCNSLQPFSIPATIAVSVFISLVRFSSYRRVSISRGL